MAIHHEPSRPGPQQVGQARPAGRGLGDRGPERRRRRSLGTTILAGLLSAGTVCGMLGCGYSPGGSVSADVVPLSAAGADPFTPPVGRDAPDVAPFEGTGPQLASVPGLYAEGTRPDGAAVCDSAQLIEHLTADPARAEAWAQVFGIPTAQIPAFAQSLTPALLRADTAVTDHRYRDGTFVAAPVVLARGTAVLVSSYGQPTVKCFNGNPLTGPLAAPPPGATTVVPAARAMDTVVFSTVGGQTLPGRPAPTPVGPTPAQIAAAQQARAEAEAAAQKAQQARADADAAGQTARDAKAQARADGRAWLIASGGISSMRTALDDAKAEAERLQQIVADWPPFFGPVPAGLTQQLEDARAAQDQAQSAYDGYLAEVDRLRTAWDESAAAAGAAAQAAQDAERIAAEAQTAADAADAAARAAEEAAGVPSPATSEPPSGEANADTPAALSAPADDDGAAAGDGDTGNGAETADTDDPGAESTTGTDGETTADDEDAGGAATAQDDEGGADDSDESGGSTGRFVTGSGAGTHSSGDTAAAVRD